MSKLTDTIELLKTTFAKSRRPAAMLSFGKDSMAMAHLIRQVKDGSMGFPIDVIYHRDPWFPHKNDFADSIIRTWGMTVHDFPPMTSGVKVKTDMLELVARYNFGIREIDIPKNVCKPEDYPRRAFMCGLNDWINRPKAFLMNYPWDTVFIGHRSADVDEFEGPVPLKVTEKKAGGVRVVFPLRHWTDDELWDYIESNHVPVQQPRYNGGKDSKWHSNDWTHACTACIDPRVTEPTVFCPKLRCQVPNHGSEVFQLPMNVDHIERQVA